MIEFFAATVAFLVILYIIWQSCEDQHCEHHWRPLYGGRECNGQMLEVCDKCQKRRRNL